MQQKELTEREQLSELERQLMRIMFKEKDADLTTAELASRVGPRSGCRAACAA